MSELTLFDGHQVSPFDSIRDVDEHGNESWSARNLMGLMAYASWQKFLVPLERAMVTARNQGHEVDTLFTRSVENSGGRPREDYQLSRFAAYLVAMNGDPNKPEVAAAQAYFAIRTREAEVMQSRPRSKAEMLLDAFKVLEADVAAEKARADAAEAQIVLDAPLVAKAVAHTAGGKAVVSRTEYAREVVTMCTERFPDVEVKIPQVYAFLHRIKLFVGSSSTRSDAGHATTDAIRKQYAVTRKGLAENGHAYAQGKLTRAGQDYAWKKVVEYIGRYGTLDLAAERVTKAVQR